MESVNPALYEWAADNRLAVWEEVFSQQLERELFKLIIITKYVSFVRGGLQNFQN